MPKNTAATPPEPKKKNTGFPVPDKKAIIPRHIPSPVKAYTSNIGRGRAPRLRWEVPEWDLALCGRIIDTESFVRRAFRNKKNLWLKEGYEFTGPNSERVQYVRRRLQQMEFATGTPFPVLLSRTINSLVRLHNAFWVKARKVDASGGRVRRVGNKTIQPVAGYFLLPAETVRFKRDEYGKIVKYAQEVYGKEIKEFKPEDVIHFCLDKREGFAVGTPITVPVQDDIRALRRIEENVELLVYQHLFPLFHYQVGTPDQPAATFPDGTTEVQVVQAEVARMPSDGCWVTPERHTVTAISAESGVPAVDKVLQYFKQRVFTGLGVSSVDMGEGGTASRSAAQTMSRNLIDDTKADQKEFGSQFLAFVIRELLLESTFSDRTLLDDENQVYLKFKEIDFESRMAKENHYTDLYLKNAITHDEMRIAMGYEPFEGDGWPTANSKPKMFVSGDKDWSRTNYGLIERDKVILQSLDEPGTDVAKSEAKSRTTTNKSAGGNSVSNKNKPANQTGSRPSAKINKDSYVVPHFLPSLERIYRQRPPLASRFNDMKADMVLMTRVEGLRMKKLKLNLDIAFTQAKDNLVSLCQQSYRAGLEDTGRFPYEVRLDKVNLKIQRHVERYVYKLKDDLLERIDKNTVKSPKLKNEDSLFMGFVFDSLSHRAEMIDDSEIMRAYNYGKASGHRLNGFDMMASTRHGDSDCAICNRHSLKYTDADVIIYEELPPLHPHCKCTMEVTAQGGTQ